jgi:hypothetical protein
VEEHLLRGGSINTVVRVGDTVRRPPSGRFVHELLGFFERSGWNGAPGCSALTSGAGRS